MKIFKSAIIIFIFTLFLVFYACKHVEKIDNSDFSDSREDTYASIDSSESNDFSEESGETDLLTKKILEILGSETMYFEAEYEIYETVLTLISAQDGEKYYSKTVHSDENGEYVELYIKNESGAYQLFPESKQYVVYDFFGEENAVALSEEFVTDVTEKEFDGIIMTIISFEDNEKNVYSCYFKDEELYAIKHHVKTNEMVIEITVRVKVFSFEITDMDIFYIPPQYAEMKADYPSEIPEFTGGNIIYTEYEENNFYFVYNVFDESEIHEYIEELKNCDFNYYIYTEEGYFEVFDKNGNLIVLEHQDNELYIIYYSYKINSISMPSGVPVCGYGKSYMTNFFNGETASYYVLFITETQINDYVEKLNQSGFTDILENTPGYYIVSDFNGNMVELIMELQTDGTIYMTVTYYSASTVNTL